MKVFLRLLGFLAPYRLQVALALFLGLVTVGSNVGLLATAAYIIAVAALQPLLATLTIPIYLVRFFGVSRAFGRYAERMVSHSLTFKLLAGLRSWFYGRLEPLAPARLSRYRSGDLLSRIVKDVDELENVYLRIVAPVAVAVLVSLLTFYVIYTFSALLASVALLFLAAGGLGVPLVVKILARGLGEKQLELKAELNARLVDGIQGMQDLISFGQEAAQEREMAALNRKLSRVQGRMAFITGLQDTLHDLLANLAVFALLILAVPLVAGGEIRGIYLAFLALVMLGSFEAVKPLGSAFQFLGRSVEAGNRLFEIVDAKPEVVDPTDPQPRPGSFVLEFDRVSFRYEIYGPPILEEISFTLNPGRRIAVVGSSGSGKSTLVNLALRFWDPVEGEIRLGGHDIRAYHQEDLRGAISVVSQDTHVFNDTLRGNLLLAKPEATDAELEEVLGKARLVASGGRLDSPLGEQGLKLSGGERQRLSVARALLEEAPLLILDEATANLDPITERELLATLYGVMPGRAALVVTHRLVELEGMDEILVLDRGKVVERGTHDMLVEAGGLYKRMLDVQRGMLMDTG